MRHDCFIRLPLVAWIVFLLNIQPSLSADLKQAKEKVEKSPAVTVEQLDSALMPIMIEIRELRAGNERLRRLVASAAPSDENAGGVESALVTIRIALVAMGLGMIGALLKLRNIVRRSKN